MLANIRQHAAYIASTIGYIDDQISADAHIITDASASVYSSLSGFYVLRLTISGVHPPSCT